MQLWNPVYIHLRSDQMTLVNLIMEAKGIIEDGAAVIKITHSGQAQSNSEKIIPGSYERKTIQAHQQLAGTVNRSFIQIPQTILK